LRFGFLGEVTHQGCGDGLWQGRHVNRGETDTCGKDWIEVFVSEILGEQGIEPGKRKPLFGRGAIHPAKSESVRERFTGDFIKEGRLPDSGGTNKCHPTSALLAGPFEKVPRLLALALSPDHALTLSTKARSLQESFDPVVPSQVRIRAPPVRVTKSTLRRLMLKKQVDQDSKDWVAIPTFLSISLPVRWIFW
jgi:hypothetical protein